jgi:mono/diheme cytochrome c family protein
MEGRFGRAAAFAALAISMMVIATAQRAQAAPAASEDARVDQGKAIYAAKCSHCHGPGMLNPGTVTPDLRKFPDDHDRFVATVKQGKNNRMPPWGDVLSDDDIAELWAYISSRRSQ